MLQWLLNIADILSDIPRTLKAWLLGLVVAGGIVAVSLAIDWFGGR